MKQREPCGCTHDGIRWLSLCPPHQSEMDAHRAREAHRHIASAPGDFTPTPEYAALAARHGVLAGEGRIGSAAVLRGQGVPSDDKSWLEG